MTTSPPAVRADDRARAAASPHPPSRAETQTLLPLPVAVLAATIAGVAMDVAFPSLGWWPLAFASITLVLIALHGRRTREALLVGAVFGAAFWFPHVSWSGEFLGEHPLGWVPWVALSTVLAILTAALTLPIAWVYRWLPRWHSTPAARLLVMPTLVAGAWTVRELVMGSWPYGGFPWGRVGLTQSESPIARHPTPPRDEVSCGF